jgi:hypothetical protein
VVIVLSNILSLKLLHRHIIGISEGGYHPLNNENLMIFCKGDFHPLRGSYGPGDESAGEWRPSTSAIDRPFFHFPPLQRVIFILESPYSAVFIDLEGYAWFMLRQPELPMEG